MELRPQLSRSCLTLVAILAGCVAHAVTLFDVDTFSDGLNRGWTNGQGGNGMTIVSGGQAGATDNYLRIESGQTFPPRLAGYNNDDRYTGSYLTAGATGVRVSMANLSSRELSMRIFLIDAFSNEWTSTVPTILAPNAQWASYEFGIGVGDLTQVEGTDPYTTSMGSITRFMIRHQSGDPSGQGTPITASAGFDNIQVVPEPASLLALSAALGAMVKRGGKKI